MTFAPPPPFPEASLRALLAGAVAAWAQAESSAGGEPRRELYLDAFAGAEFQFGTGVWREPGDATRAAAALRALDACARPAPRAGCAFVEEDPAHLQRVYAELEDVAGGERLRATRDLRALAPGEATLVEAPFASVAAELAAAAGDARVFAFAAPPSARALPWSALRQLVAIPDATVLVRFPHTDFEKQSRHTGPLADLPGFARRIVEGCSALLDDARHAWLPAWRADLRDGSAAPLARVLDRYREMLDGAAGDRLVKPMQLETADGAAAWLFLVTPHPAVAMAVDTAIRAAGLIDRASASVDRPAASASAPTSAPPAKETSADASPVRAPTSAPAEETSAGESPVREPSRRKPRRERPIAAPSDASTGTPAAPATPAPAEAPPPAPVVTPPIAERAPAAEVLDLFPDDVAAPPEPPLRFRPDAAAIGAALESRFAGRTVAWRDVLAAFAASDVSADELKAALALLRRRGRAVYRALKAEGDEIEFPSEPILRPRPARRKTAADDGLFATDDETDD